MAWTLKTSGVALKLATCIVLDPTDNKIKDLGTSGAIEGTNITRAHASVVNVDRTTGGYGWGFYTNRDAGFTPGEVVFSGTKPSWVNATTGGMIFYILNRIRTGDSVASREWALLTDPNNPVMGTDASSHGLVRSAQYTVAVPGTTVLPFDVPFGLFGYYKRAATADSRLYYGLKSGGTVAAEGTPVAINDAGGTSTLTKLGTDAAGAIVAMEIFMVGVAPVDLLSGAEMDSILSDPVGTLIDTGGGGGAVKRNNLGLMGLGR